MNLKVLILSDYHKLAIDINSNLKNKGHETILLTTRNFCKSDDVINISDLRNDRIIWLLNALRSFIYRHIIFWTKDIPFYQDISERREYYSFSKIKKKLRTKPDVVIVLFDYRIITAKTIRNLYKWSRAKFLWMAVDMKPMTGGCSYSGSCTNYQSDCDNCPAINNFIFKDYAKKQLQTKIDLINGIDLTIITGSLYQKSQAELSSIFKCKPIYSLIFPTDETLFKPRDKTEARKFLNLPLDKKIILFGATDITEPRKGFNYLLRALKLLEARISVENIMLLMVGQGEDKRIKSLQYEVLSLGFVNYEVLAMAYQSADVFVCPTIEDSGPVMVIQSMLCGTPVVGFEMGVNLDLIENNKTGYIARLKNENELSHGIQEVLSFPQSIQQNISSMCVAKSKLVGSSIFYEKLNELILV